MPSLQVPKSAKRSRVVHWLVCLLFLVLEKNCINATTIEQMATTTNSNENENKAQLSEQVQSAPSKLQNATTIKQTYTTITHTETITHEIPKERAFSEKVDVTKPYCEPTLCELYNGTHLLQQLHTACQNNGSFGPTCGQKPHLLYMSERRRNLIVDMHNLAREKIASGQLEGYQPAAHMPVLKWDNELEYLASLHVRRCEFAHDKCRNTARYPYSGQNIGYFWIGREFKSHSRRMKSFVIDWFREYKDANQTFIDKYRLHPEDKKIGHFTMLVSDRAHRVGCAAIRFHEPKQPDDTRFLMTCNYDFNNILGEPIYQSGPTASKCAYKRNEKFPALCDWKDAIYDYDSEESIEDDNNKLDNNID